MALSLPETPVRQDQDSTIQAKGTLGLLDQRQMKGAPDSGRPPGY